MKNLYLLSMLGIAFVCGNAAQGDDTYTTSTGAVFTRVQGPGRFGKASIDPSGTIWSAYQGDFANNALKPDRNKVVVDSPATEACEKIGGVLPTAEQYKIAKYFELDSNEYLTDQGRKDLYTIFPDMVDSHGSARGFWTSSAISDDSAYLFGADSGIVGYIDGYRLNNFIGVRCVGL